MTKGAPRYSSGVALLCILSGTVVSAADQAEQKAKAIGPFLDEARVLMLRVDVPRIEPRAITDRLLELIPDAQPEAERIRASLSQTQQALRKAGVKELYVLLSLQDLPRNAPTVVIPGAADIDQTALAQALSWMPDKKVTSVRGTIVVAAPSVLERYQATRTIEHPQLLDVLKTVGDSPVQLVVIPSDDDRRVIEEMQPTLPAEIGGGPSSIVTRGVVWIAVAFELPPTTSFNVTIQSKDPESAANLREKLREVVEIVSGMADKGGNQQLARVLPAMIPTVSGSRLVLSLNPADRTIKDVVEAVRPALEQTRDQARRRLSMNNLKQLGLALHNFHDSQKAFPASHTVDAQGKPLLSWRVQILPYLDQKKLYDQFHLSEPWDSPHNSKLISQMPEVFKSPNSKRPGSEGWTVYREIVGDHTAFPASEGIAIRRITDGTSNTVMLMEVDDQHAVQWTQPEGLTYQNENPIAGLSGQYPGGICALFCDGSVRFLRMPQDPDLLRRLLLIDDGRPLPAEF